MDRMRILFILPSSLIFPRLFPLRIRDEIFHQYVRDDGNKNVGHFQSKDAHDPFQLLRVSEQPHILSQSWYRCGVNRTTVG